MSPQKRVSVLGAGVSGLTTAVLLLQREEKFEVLLVAKHFPGELNFDYTSPLAGAHWRSYASSDDFRQQEFDKITYNHFWYLAQNYPTETGIMFVDGFDYWDELPKNFSEPWFKTFCPNYRHLEKHELPDGVGFGITYKTVTINPESYLNYLLNTFISLGGTTRYADLAHIQEAIFPETNIVINCSGIHARKLGGVQDINVYSAKGQIVLVELPPNHVSWTFERYSAGSNNGGIDSGGIITYVIPRNTGEVILGGTYDQEDYSAKIDPAIADSIMKRCLATRPDLFPKNDQTLKVKRHSVGLRPCRKGGIRIEAEWIVSEKSLKEILICHNYGHGGYGYQSSYGAALSVIQLLELSLIGKKSKL
ncbi:hypothetical protein G9A89_023500 [Geosiphon pyriformis]|nr:hypothetical protein G9A89_023500 [Geosiphon pyriformis]